MQTLTMSTMVHRDKYSNPVLQSLQMLASVACCCEIQQTFFLLCHSCARQQCIVYDDGVPRLGRSLLLQYDGVLCGLCNQYLLLGMYRRSILVYPFSSTEGLLRTCQKQAQQQACTDVSHHSRTSRLKEKFFCGLLHTPPTVAPALVPQYYS